MFGSRQFKPIHGNWHHVGYLTTDELPIPVGTTLPKGTWCSSKPGNEFKMQLASGYALGVLTQDVDNEGTMNLTVQRNLLVGGVLAGATEVPAKKGHAVSLRVPDANAEMQFEGLGAAVPGNLVCTTGTGAISAATARNAELSFLNGCIRLAQTGDIVQLLMLDANETPELAGQVRIRVKYVAGYVK